MIGLRFINMVENVSLVNTRSNLNQSEGETWSNFAESKNKFRVKMPAGLLEASDKVLTAISSLFLFDSHEKTDPAGAPILVVHLRIRFHSSVQA